MLQTDLSTLKRDGDVDGGAVHEAGQVGVLVQDLASHAQGHLGVASCQQAHLVLDLGQGAGLRGHLEDLGGAGSAHEELHVGVFGVEQVVGLVVVARGQPEKKDFCQAAKVNKGTKRR